MRKTRKKKYKLKWKNLLVIILFIFSITLLYISVFRIVNWSKDNLKVEKQINNIIEDVNINEIEIDPDTIDSDESNMYFDFMNMKLIDVDLNSLKQINSDTKGWVQVNGTKINYPFVQTNNNDYYLTHAFDKSYNKAGWVFADFRNKLDGTDKNLILYAHGRVNKTMFGSLKDTLKQKWFNDSSNHFVKISSEYESSLWQIFSVYRIPTTNDYIQTDFSDGEDFLTLMNTLRQRSVHAFNVDVTENDSIITLSTCYNADEKIVVHAKLVSRVEK